MHIEYSKEVVKYLNKTDTPTKKRLKQAFEKLANEPPQGDMSPLQGKKNLYRLRTGDLRILFSIDKAKNIIVVNKIAPRGEAYK